MAKTSKTHRIVQAMFNEAVALPGCPQIIVTRIWLATWLRDALGYDPKERGFGSIDYLAFGRKESPEPLTDLTDPNVASLLAFIVQTETA